MEENKIYVELLMRYCNDRKIDFKGYCKMLHHYSKDPAFYNDEGFKALEKACE